MTVVVVASVMVSALVDSGPDGGWAVSVVSAETLAAPELILVETTSILRRLERRGEISRIEANGARRDLLRRDIELLPFAPFSDRIWELRHKRCRFVVPEDDASTRVNAGDEEPEPTRISQPSGRRGILRGE